MPGVVGWIWAVGLLAAIFGPSGYVTLLVRCVRRLLLALRMPAAERRRLATARHFMEHVVHKLVMRQQHYAWLLPLLAAAPRVGAAAFGAADRVRLRPAAGEGSFKVVALPALRRRLGEVADGLAPAPDSSLSLTPLDRLVQACLPEVTPPDGYDRDLTLDDCVYVGAPGCERGAPLPLLHTDTEWGLLPGAEGFQVWYCLNLDSRCAAEGNLFLADASGASLAPGRPSLAQGRAAGAGRPRPAREHGAPPPLPWDDDESVAFHFAPDGSLRVVANDGSDAPPGEPTYGATRRQLGGAADAASCGLRFRYVDARPGECLIMSRTTLHMSDPRPWAAGRPAVDRRAVTMRVAIKPPPQQRGGRAEPAAQREGDPSAEVAAAAAREAGLQLATGHPAYAGKLLPKLVFARDGRWAT